VISAEATPPVEPGEHGVDPPCHHGAQMPQMLLPAATGFAPFRLVDPARGAKGVANPPDPGEIKLALEVAPAGQSLDRYWIKHRLEADAVAGVERVALGRNVHAQKARLVAGLQSGQRIGVDDDAPALFRQIDVGNSAGDGDRPEAALQHRRVALPRGLPHQRKARGEGGEG